MPNKYMPNSRERCPHCLTTVHFARDKGPIQPTQDPKVAYTSTIIRGNTERLQLRAVVCPSCGKAIVSIDQLNNVHSPAFKVTDSFVVWPQSSRAPVPAEVPAHIAEDYVEAAQVLPISPKASAALSRRCLQAVLREAGNASQRDLIRQIEAVLPTLPSYIAENIDAIRNIGNFAAHPLKDTASGQILAVEPGEAEWNLNVLDQLFDHYYVQPAVAAQKRAALNAKLAAANKPPMK